MINPSRLRHYTAAYFNDGFKAEDEKVQEVLSVSQSNKGVLNGHITLTEPPDYPQGTINV